MLEIKIMLEANETLIKALSKIATAISSNQTKEEIGAKPSIMCPPAAEPVVPVNPAMATAVPSGAAPVQIPVTQTAAQTINHAPIVDTTPVQSTPVASATMPTTNAVPTAAPQYTLEMLAVAGSSLIDAGKLDQLKTILNKYNVDALTSLDPNLYGAVATELRALGARI